MNISISSLSSIKQTILNLQVIVGGNVDILCTHTLIIMLYIWFWNISVWCSYILPTSYPKGNGTAINKLENSVGNSRWGANVFSSLLRVWVSLTAKVCLSAEKKLQFLEMSTWWFLESKMDSWIRMSCWSNHLFCFTSFLIFFMLFFYLKKCLPII